MKFFRGVFFGTLLSIPIWVMVFWAIRAYADMPAIPKDADKHLSTWVHVQGCPKGSSDTFLIFDNGSVLHIDDNKLGPDQVKTLVAMIGERSGINQIYPCGNDI